MEVLNQENQNNELGVSIDDICNNARTGDLLFFECDHTSLSSKMIKIWLGSNITHVALVYRPKQDITIKELGELKQDVCYSWEMGRNTDAKTMLGTGNNFTEARLVNMQEMLMLRKTKMYWKRMEMNSDLFKYQLKGFDEYIRSQIEDQVRNYILSKVTSPYDPYISSFWLMRDGIWPFPSRYHHKIEDQFLPPVKVIPKHCSQLIFQTCAYSKIFRTRKDSYIISPGDIFDLTKELSSPFVTYSSFISIKP